MNERDIFSQALQRPAGPERSAYLDEACGSDLPLRRQIEVLLAEQDDLGSFLEHSPVATRQTRVRGVPDQPAEAGDGAGAGDHADTWLGFLSPCDTPDRLGALGQYEVIEVIGRGGTGLVLRAMDTRLHRIVAVKVLDPQLASQTVARQRFLREAQAAAAVSHPHVVTIHGVDKQGDLPFIVMECVDGQSLQQKIERCGALPLREVLRIGSQAAWGLAAAHQQGLVHRDFKPANILLENHVERVKLTDFGLVRAQNDVGLTVTGQVSGTPQYMAPEQAVGLAVDRRADLFSLGSVLYAMCTGRAAFRADSAVAVLRRVCDDTPRPIRETNPDVPDWLVAVIEKLHEKNPDQRYQSAGEVAELLEDRLARMQGPSHPAGPESDRSSRSVAAAGATAAAGSGRAAGDSAASIQAGRRGWGFKFAIALLLVMSAGLALAEAIGLTAFTSSLAHRGRQGGVLPGGSPVDAAPGAQGIGPPAQPAPVTSAELFTSDRFAWAEQVEMAHAPVSWGMHLSVDGLTLLYAIVDPQSGDEDLWMQTRATPDGLWSEPASLGPVINSPRPDNAPSMTADRLILLFESQREGGYGASDLWMSRRRSADEPWEAPVNLGEMFNDEGWQRTPMISRDGLTLMYTTTFPGRVGNFLHESTRRSVDDPWPAARPVVFEDGTGQSFLAPALADDKLTLFLGDGSEGVSALYMSTRRSPSAVWGVPRRLSFPGRFPGIAGGGRGLVFCVPERIMSIRRVERNPAAARPP